VNAAPPASETTPEGRHLADPIWDPTRPPPESVVIVKPSSLGDIVHTLPAVARVRRHWPKTRLQWLVNSEWAPLLEGNPHVDEILDFPRRAFRGIGATVAAARWAARLHGTVSADLVLDFQGLLRSGTFSKLCRSANGTVVGLSDAREGARLFYDHSVEVSAKSHAVDRYLALVAALGVQSAEPLEWPLPSGQRPNAEIPSHFVLVHPFSRGRGKSMSREDLQELCARLSSHPVIIAGQCTRDDIPKTHALNLLNRTTLPELIWLIRHADFVVSVDSGPMHIAAAVAPRLLSIHTWSDPRKVGPYRDDAWIWQKGALRQMRDLTETGSKSISTPGIREIGEWLAAQMTND
jgi:heptosyltransferase-1